MFAALNESLHRLGLKLRALFNRRRLERDLDDEVAFHLAMREQKRREEGAADAAAAARREFGNPTLLKETNRAQWTFSTAESLAQDVRYGARVLRKNPAFTAVAVITLALGIGANTAIFSVVQAVLLNRLPYRNPERLVSIAATDRFTVNPSTVSFLLTQDWRERTRSFSSIALYRDWGPAYSGEGHPQILRGIRVSANFFSTLGVQPVRGRDFTADEDQPERWRIVLLSYSFWQEQFGGREDIVGRNIMINQRPYLVLGVLPATFHPTLFSMGGPPPQVWAPLGYGPTQPNACRSCQHLQAVARLADGVSIEQARAELNTASAQLARDYPKDYAGDLAAVVTPLQERLVRNVRAALWLLLAATGFVLLIACANVANLLLSRAAARGQEMALRAALGARRLRLLRQLLTESVLLTLSGGLGGLLLATWGVQALVAAAPRGIPRMNEVQLDGTVLGASLGIALLAGLLAGLAPALQASGVEQRSRLQEAGRGAVGDRRAGLRTLLVTGEVALALMLAVGAGLLLKGLARVTAVHPGFEINNLYAAAYTIVGSKYTDNAVVARFERDLVDRLRATRGVESAALVSTLPLAGSFDRRGFHILDRPLAHDSEAPSVDAYYVSEDYLRTMQIPVLRGRGFTAADVQPNAPSVAVISESTARQMWPGEDPMGKRIQLGGREEKRPWAEIVGIVGDVRQYGLDGDMTADAYLLNTTNPGNAGIVVVRSAMAPDAVRHAIEEAVASLDKSAPVSDGGTFHDVIAGSLAQRRFVLYLVGGFGLLALTLACVGIYGVMAFHVTQRTGEFGVRMALGATPRSILRLVVGQGLRFAVLGVLAGVLGALVLTRLIANQLFHVQPRDPVAFGAAIGAVFAGMLLACYIPALRATRVDPMEALRYE